MSDINILMKEYIAAWMALEPADRKHFQSHGREHGVKLILSLGRERAEIYEQIFGNGRETLERDSFYRVICALGGMEEARGNGPKQEALEEAGWNGPRKEADNGIDTLDNTKDYHVWCVDKDDNGRIFDYPDNQIATTSKYKTNTIARQAWPSHLVDSIRPRLEQEAQLYISALIEQHYGSKEAMMTAIQQNTFARDYCIARAYLLHESNPSRLKVVIGAVGFVQSDGRTFWEQG